MKTYSRLKKRTHLSSEPATKRRRIHADQDEDDEGALRLSSDAALLRSDCASAPRSSPPRETSDAALPSSTPPSSPPPARTTTASTPPLPLPKRRPTFSFFARRTAPPTAPRPSAAISAASPLLPPLPPTEQRNPRASDANASSTATTLAGPKEKRTQPRLTQLQLDLGTTPVQRACGTCGMAYVPANAEDAALHRKFHALNVGGVEVGKAFARGGGGGVVVWEKGVDGDVVVAVGRRDRGAAKARARRVLEVVQSELGAVKIPEEELWGQVVVGGGMETAEEEVEAKPQTAAVVGQTGVKKTPEETVLRADRFKAYLYVRGSKCIGLCLAERITEAYRIMPPQNTPSPPGGGSSTDTPSSTEPPAESNRSPALTTSPTSLPARLGISRIWVSSSHRRHGIATALLDAAARDFCDLYSEDEKRVPKERIAFSQPTENGARLATRWFGVEAGWGVYW